MVIKVNKEDAELITEKLGISEARAEELKDVLNDALLAKDDIVDCFKVISSKVTDDNELALTFFWAGQAMQQMRSNPMLKFLAALHQD